MSSTNAGANDLRQIFNKILDDLLTATAASRATLRIDIPAFSFHVDDPAGEARAPGVRPLSGETALDQRALDTVRWMEEHRDYLIQEKCRGANPAPPDALIDIYGVQAQMLGPILRNDELLGWISVHENRTTRAWSSEDIAALKEAVSEVNAVLDPLAI